MPAARIICPGCKIVLTSAQALAAGKLVDCPRCRLLFVTTAEDISNPLSRAEEIAAERHWGEADMPRPFPKSSPYKWRRRFRGLTAKELGSIFLACGIMLFLAGVVVTTYLLYRSGVPRASTPSTNAPPRVVADEPAAPAPAGGAEVEDDRPAPRKPVPPIEDAPPGKPPPP